MNRLSKIRRKLASRLRVVTAIVAGAAFALELLLERFGDPGFDFAA